MQHKRDLDPSRRTKRGRVQEIGRTKDRRILWSDGTIDAEQSLIQEREPINQDLIDINEWFGW